ncbi:MULTISPECIES: AAA family ATPase [Thermomonospora]|uniref:AAA ATPase n=1 Tax=Thermomonospora curvata (strain ATCC 19995 / DSM 43183 / JCM 3096 / KCTC 9072 / NBRC 15933 / NCIMB 10081 / Henssen B9) TaxID=471852 RepID=D1A804_THECD|nr:MULTISPECIES: AAA family ATPase [Thermomonospora]ACY98526.1 AAA ATPase [Thermomonospora curvata DSM 43183]PKK13667.1 MAG: AAA family ATPase [Thermomonospora sp. CIF 1]
MAGERSGPATLADRLRQARRRRFVGRAEELELLRSALACDEPPFGVLFVHGPGGVGKSTLLTMLAEVAEEAGARPVRLDARTLEPTPPAFLAAVRALGGDREREGARTVLMVDTCELLAPLEEWLREEFLPSLPATTLVVLAGRHPPSPHWRADPGWRELLRVVALRNLPPRDGQALLSAAGVPRRLHRRVLAATHGHPLALSLVADVIAQHLARRRETAEPPLPLGDPHVVRVLLENFIDTVPSRLHRRALEVCAHARFTTEELLRAVLEDGDAHELFEWLCGLSFIETGVHGLFPHDVARDVLDTELRWRDPASYHDLHRRIRGHIVAQVQRSTGLEQQRRTADFVFLHRANPVVSRFWDWETFGLAHADELRPKDRDPLLAMTELHQGPEQAELLAFWMDRPAARILPIRTAGEEEPIGYAGMLALHEAGEPDIAADPGARAVWQYALRNGAPRPGEQVWVARFFMDREHYQRPSPSQNVVTTRHIQHLLSSKALAWDFIAGYEDADFWEPLLRHIDYHRVHEASYEVGGRRYGVFAHDFRRLGVEEWLDLMSDREIGAEAAPPTGPAPELVLSRPDFAEAVRAALRDLHRDDRLAGSPLLRSRVVRERGEPVPDTLRALLCEAAQALGADVRDDRPYRAIDRTYLRPAATQERAAEILGLPFSTYRRHLARGVERIVDWLWTRELQGP